MSVWIHVALLSCEFGERTCDAGRGSFGTAAFVCDPVLAILADGVDFLAIDAHSFGLYGFENSNRNQSYFINCVVWFCMGS